MPSLAEVVRRHGAAYLCRYSGSVLPSHRRALSAITDCRTAALGASVAECGHCQSKHLFYHSCRHRACPRCGHDKTARWIESQRSKLLPVPYFHLVFTLPAELRRIVRRHQKILGDVLFRAAFESLSQLASDPQYLGGQIGALAVLHTWTRTLEWHPHVHMLVPGGALATDGRTFRTVRRKGRKDFLVPVRPLAKLFRARFLHLARRALQDVPLPHIPWGKNWVVYAKRSMHAPAERLLEYLGRYVHKTALTDSRIAAVDDQSVTFLYRDNQSHKRKAMRLDGGEFLRRFLQHIPARGFHRVRSYGLLHSHHRHLLRRLQLLLQFAPDAPAPIVIDGQTVIHAASSHFPPPSRVSRSCPTCHQPTLRFVRQLSPFDCLAALSTSPTTQPRPPP